MLFASYEFILFFIAVVILYYVLPKKWQWGVLLLASLFFYYCADPWYLLFITITAMTVYGCGLWIGSVSLDSREYLKSHKETLTKEEKKAHKARIKKKKWHILLLGLLFNLGILAVIKYTNFTIHNVNSIRHLFGQTDDFAYVNLIMPMGISFYTFQALGYLIDCYRGTIEPEKNPFKFLLFVSFFPQLVQGPISRFGDLSRTLYGPHKWEWKNVSFGMQRILWGFFKKLVIADRIVTGVNEIIHNPETYRGAYVFLGMLFYALELYADFTGGIDITIGVAEVLGIKVTENFHRPYFSKSIKEYWNRWHITMGTWFTDYIFYPVTVSGPMLKLSKYARAHFPEAVGRRLPVYLSSFLVWFATGIWHGASWNFIVWGLGNWVVIMISQELEPLYRRFHATFKVRDKWGFRLFQIVRTFLLMCSLRSFDCYRDVPLTFQMFGSMFTTFNWKILFDGSLLSLGLSITDYVILALGVVLLIMVSLVQRSGSVREKLQRKPYLVRYVAFTALFVVILLTGAYGNGYDASQFIYNQF